MNFGIWGYLLFFCFSICRIGFGLRITKYLEYLDKPGPDTDRTYRVPTAQGIFLVLGIVISLVFFLPTPLATDYIAVFLFCSALLVGVTVRDTLGDDRIAWFRPVASYWRLLIQVVIGTIVWYFVMYDSGNVGTNSLISMQDLLPFFQAEGSTLLVLDYILTISWFVFFINAINRFDGVSGLASGVGAIGHGTISLLLRLVVIPYYGYSETNDTIAHICFIISIFAGLYALVESKPRGLLRDIGIMFLGFSLAYFSLVGGAKVGTILVAVSLVVMDAVWVFFYRVFIKKKNPLSKDYSHLHYRLLALGRNRSEIRAFVRIFSLVFMIFMLLQGTDRTDKIIIFVLSVLLFFGIHLYLYLVKKLPREYTPPLKSAPSQFFGPYKSNVR